MAAQQNKDSDKWRFPLRPKKGNLQSSDREQAFNVDPLENLPGFLLPSATRGKNRRPPTLHLGWLIDDTVLLRLAEERGIGAPEDLREFLKHEDYEFEDDDFDFIPEGPNSLHKMQAFALRCRELQLNNFPGLARVYDSSTKDTAFVVSFRTNYEAGTGRIGKNDWDKLVNEFKFEGKPKWYLDFGNWHWK